MPIDSSKENTGDSYVVSASESTPQLHTADFILIATEGDYVDTFEFSLTVGSLDYLVWNPDPTPTPGQNVDSILESLGFAGDYSTTLPISDLYQYGAIFVCVGMYGNKYMIGSASPEAGALVNYLNDGGRMYLEGGDVWYFDPQYGGYNFCPLFGINAVSDGGNDLGPVVGEVGTFTDGMNFTYGGENVWADRINPTGSGFLIFHDGDNAYNCGVANDSNTYRTVGTSFELGLLNDTIPPSTRAELLKSIMEFFGFVIPDTVPPLSPNITQAEKSGNDVIFTWNTVATDTLANPEDMDCYVVYRNTSPSFILSPSDSIGAVFHPDTTYTAAGIAHPDTPSYYYLVKAVDGAGNRSEKSNMGYVFGRQINENPGVAADRNWMTLPWYSEYDSISQLTADLSPNAEAFNKVTNLDEQTQNSFSYFWHAGLARWLGTNFSIMPGHFYEFNGLKDTTLVVVGSHCPHCVIELNENPGATADRNWVSLAYNAAYDSVQQITHDLSSDGSVINKITNLVDTTQAQFSWFYHVALSRWLGTNFTIVPGHGYEFNALVDTTWDPYEWSNEAGPVLACKSRQSDVKMYLGQLNDPDRESVWSVERRPVNQASREPIDLADARVYEPVKRSVEKMVGGRVPGISHLVLADLRSEEFENLVFTAYRPDLPYDALTENMVGSGIAWQGDWQAMWFDVANFKQPWEDEEEIVVIIEATKEGRGYFTVLNVQLELGNELQHVGEISLMPIPEPTTVKGLLSWSKVDNANVVGYSLYRDDERINERVIARSDYRQDGDVVLKPVIKGGHETVYSSQGVQSTPDMPKPVSYAFNIQPNPFVRQTRVEYALPKQTSVDIVIYDATGRKVTTLVSHLHKPGFYSTLWNGADNKGRKVSSGVYFIRFQAGDFRVQDKMLLVK